MAQWGFVEWFSIISGIASIISLIIALIINNKVVKIQKNITNSNSNSYLTNGSRSPIQNSNQGDNYYEGGN